MQPMTLPTADQLDAQFPAIRPEAWRTDSDVTFLNHGSFGACPRPVLDRQMRLREQLEANPLRFLVDEAPPLLDRSRSAMADLLRVAGEDLVFVQSATAGVNAVLRSLDFKANDEILYLDQAYGSCINVVHHVCRRTGAVPVVAEVRWPGSSPDQVIDAVQSKVGPRTKLAMIDHLTSRAGLRLPVKAIVDVLEARGIDVLIDGAHAPGQIELDVASLGAAYYTGNCHKWLCGPKAAAVLHVRPDKQDGIEPAIISAGSRFDLSGANYGDFQQRFAWQGTSDPTAAICVGESLGFLASLLPDGLPALMKRNHDMVVALRRLLCEVWSVPEPCPETMLGAMAAMPICKGYDVRDSTPVAQVQHAFTRGLRYDAKIECQPLAFGSPPILHARISCHAYNHGSQLLPFIDALTDRVDPMFYRQASLGQAST